MSTHRADRFVHHKGSDYDAYKAQMQASEQNPASLKRAIEALRKMGPEYAGEVRKLEAKLRTLGH